MYGCFIFPTCLFGKANLYRLHLATTLVRLRKHSSVFYIGPKSTLETLGEDLDGSNFGGTSFKGVDFTDLKQIPIIPLEKEFFNDLLQPPNSPFHVFHFIRHQSYQPLVDYLVQAITKINNIQKVTGIFSWFPCPSLKKAGELCNIPIIFTELSGLRYPNAELNFFDFSGLNQDNEVNSLYQNYKAELKRFPKKSLPRLSQKELIELLIADTSKELFSAPETNEFEYGVALQAPFYIHSLQNEKAPLSNAEFISYLNDKLDPQTILWRSHLRREQVPMVAYSDYSETSITFMKKVKRVITLSSNMALESLLLDKTTYVLATNPHNFMAAESLTSQHNASDLLLKLNFFIFCYLTPFDVFYNEDYLTWRLSRPSLYDIYVYHYNHLIQRQINKKADITTQDLIFPPRIKVRISLWDFLKKNSIK